MVKDNLKTQGIKAFIWDFTGKIANQGIMFIVTIFLARLLEPSDFGLIAICMIVLGIAGIFSDIGLMSALIQRKRVLPIHYSSVFYFNIVFALILSFLTYFSAPFIAEFYNNTELILLIQTMSIFFVIDALNGVHAVQLRKKLNFRLLTKIRITSSLIGGVIGIFLAFKGAGVWSLVIEQLISRVIGGVLIWKTSHWRPNLIFSFKALFQLWAFGFRMFLSSLLDAIFMRLDFIIIGKLFTPTILGFYQRAKGLNFLIVSYASGSLMNVLFPVLSKVKNDLTRFQNIIIKSLGVISFIVFYLSGIFFLVSEELIIMLFTEKWLPSVDFFRILILSAFAHPIGALLLNVLSSRGNSKAFLRLEIYKKILLSINLYIGFLWGVNGYLYGLLFVSFLTLYLDIFFASREIKVAKLVFIRLILVQASIGIISTFIVWYINIDLELINIIKFVIKGIEFTILYVGINFLLKIKSYQYFMEQFNPVLRKVLKRKNK